MVVMNIRGGEGVEGRCGVQQILFMYSYSYNIPKPSISRLDELLNRNELIYQNLKQKLEGINKSNQNIYKNINHIQTNFSDPFSQESSAIEREPTMKNQSIKIDHQEQIPRFHNTNDLQRIDQHQEITFSEDQNQLDILAQEMRLKRLLLQEEKLRDLEHILEKERQMEDQRMVELHLMKKEREDSERKYREQIYKGRIDEGERSSRRQSYRRQDYEGELIQSKISTLSQRRRNGAVKQQKVGVKNNSIYLSRIPKTSPLDIQEQIPTFRQSYSQKKDNRFEQKATIRQQQGVNQLSSNRQHQEQTIPRSNRSDDRGRKLESKRENTPLMQQNYRVQNENKARFELSSIKHNDNHDNHDTLEINFETTIAKTTQKSHQNMTPYGELNSHFKIKLQEIDTISQCYLFAPFNKVYRSPILQIKPGCIMLQRKSKTSSLTATSRSKIVDGLKYKFKTVVTDEQLLLKNLFCSQENLNFDKKESNKVAIVGGRQCLKKKIHMGLLAYCHQQLAIEIQRAGRLIVVKIEHQSITPSQEPLVIDLTIEADPTSRKISLMQLDKMVNDMYDVIKKWTCKGKKILRMTKIALIEEGNLEWTYSIISSNRYDYQFLKHLKVNKICWSINPLIKYYQQVKETLDSMRNYVQNRRTA